MPYLLYCVMEDVGDQTLPLVRGVAGASVSWFSEGGLRAIVSKYDLEIGTDLLGLIAYRDVIQSCHQLQTVVPMRYGCTFPEPFGILSFLREGQARYKGLLKELDGLVEMGIRVLGEGGESNFQDLESDLHVGSMRGAGRAFLAAKKARYDRKDKATAAQQALASRCRDSFSGLYAKCKEEHLRLLTLYFLVPKKGVEAFQRAFHKMKVNRSEKLLLSGPWPPFNFVV
jgi:hypothetical protein